MSNYNLILEYFMCFFFCLLKWFCCFEMVRGNSTDPSPVVGDLTLWLYILVI
jgi:hypothetical protein